MLKTNEIYLGNCLQIMKQIDDKSIDLILCDLPFQVTQNKWDIIIPFEPLWTQYNRIIKENGAIVLHATQPFTTLLINSNIKDFKYCWYWDKVNRITGYLNSKKQPLRQMEEIVVFYSKQPTYNPQMTDGKPYSSISSGKSENYGKQADKHRTVCNGKRYPRNLISIKADERGTCGRIHPTQKPIELLEYLIKTYSNEGAIVLDNTCGSGSTLQAAKNLGRQYIGIEQNEFYFNIAKLRLNGEPYLHLKSKTE